MKVGSSIHPNLFLSIISKVYNLKIPCQNLYSICPLEDRATHVITKSINTVSNINNKQCTLLLLLNLAKPEWIPVGCHDKLVKYVVCFSKTEYSNKDHVLDTVKTVICERTSILYKDECFLFFPCQSQPCTISRIITGCRNLDLFNVFDDEESLDFFTVIYGSMSLQNIYFAVFNKEMRKLVYFYAKRNTRIWMGNVAIMRSSNSKNCSTYFPCKFQKFQQIINHELVYKHPNAYFISMNFLCETKNNDNTKSNSNPICNVSFLFYKSITGKYLAYSQQTNNDVEQSIPQNFNLEEYELLESNSQSADEILHQNIIKLTCQNSQSKWYKFSHVCIYRLDTNSDLLPCKTGSHIEQCQDFECNVHFKCPGYYCIPWGYICDGKWDCPDGCDESIIHQCQGERTCTDMFKCKDSQICLHLEDICNNYSECPLGDDELLCELRGGHCFLDCTCFQFAMMCDKGPINHRKLEQLPYVYYHLTFISSLVTSVLRNGAALIVNIAHNSIHQICGSLKESTLLTMLDLSHNLVEKLTRKCFSGHRHIRKLILTNNSLSDIQPKAFNNLQKLFLVDLSLNNLNTLPIGAFTNVVHLIILILHSNPLKDIHYNMFIGISLDIVHSNNFQVCCIANSQFICTKPKLSYYYCGNLLINYQLSICFMITTLLILFANCTLLFSLFQNYNTFGKPYLIIEISMILTNLFLLFLFTVLWSADLYYSYRFVIKMFTWQESVLCTLVMSGFLLYSLFQPFLLTILSIGRLMVVLYPFKSKFKSLGYTLKIIVLGLTCMALISVIFGYAIRFQVLQNNLCSPFVDHREKNLIIWVTTIVMAVIHLVTVISTTSMYTLMIKEMIRSQISIRATKMKSSGVNIIKHVILLTTSKILCWIPASIIFLTALIVEKYPVEMVHWATALIFPNNAIIIPIILTLNSQHK